MNIEAYMKMACKQTAVYWGTPVLVADASFTFAAPVEIACLWKEKITVITDKNGKEVVSKASVDVTQDLDDEGMLFFGELIDLTVAEKADPKTVPNAYEIMLFLKIPSLQHVTKFKRTAML